MGKCFNQSGQGRASLLLITLVVVAFVAIPWYTHNSLTDKEESVYSAWATIQSNMQRRADLIPSLLQTVGKAMEYESETLKFIADRQSKALAKHVQSPPEDADALREIADLDKQVSVNTQHVLIQAAAMPELRATDQFLQLQSQLEGTENRINIARIRYNEAVRKYNSAIRGFIGRHVASSLALEPRPYFEASEDVSQPVKMDFH